MKKWIAQLQEVQKQLRTLRAEEFLLRNKIADKLATKSEGAETFLVDDWKVTVTINLRRTIDEAVLDSIGDKLSQADKDAVAWKPALVLKTYRSLPANSILQKAVTTKPSPPTVKIE